MVDIKDLTIRVDDEDDSLYEPNFQITMNCTINGDRLMIVSFFNSPSDLERGMQTMIEELIQRL